MEIITVNILLVVGFVVMAYRTFHWHDPFAAFAMITSLATLYYING